jgi:hypothetical protein
MKYQISLLLLVILYFGMTSCGNLKTNSLNKSLSGLDTLDKNGLVIDIEILSSIVAETGKKWEPFNKEVWKYLRDGDEENYKIDTGIIFKFIDIETAQSIFTKYSKKVQNEGNYLFLTNLDFDSNFNSYFDIVIINRPDPYEIIDLIGTGGINYDVYTDDVIRKLKQYDSLVDFTIEVIGEARIHAYMAKLPDSLSRFTADVYKFCPDVIDQGYDSMEEMIEDYKLNKYFWLWWD